MGSKKKKPLNQFFKFSNIALQMGVIIGFGAYAGVKLDEYLQKEFPLFTLLFSLFAVFSALYYVIKEVIHINNDN